MTEQTKSVEERLATPETAKQDGYVIPYVQNASEELCLQAIKEDDLTVTFMDTEKVLKALSVKN